MKKMMAVMLALVLALAFTACAGQATDGTQPQGGGAHKSSYPGETWDDGSAFASLPKVLDGNMDSYTISEDGSTLTVVVLDITSRQAMDYYEELIRLGAQGEPTIHNKVSLSYSSNIGKILFSSFWYAADSPVNSAGTATLTVNYVLLGDGGGTPPGPEKPAGEAPQSQPEAESAPASESGSLPEDDASPARSETGEDASEVVSGSMEPASSSVSEESSQTESTAG